MIIILSVLRQTFVAHAYRFGTGYNEFVHAGTLNHRDGGKPVWGINNLLSPRDVQALRLSSIKGGKAAC